MKNNFIQKDFLQSNEWQKFQETAGRKTFLISSPHPNPLPQAGGGGILFHANIIEHDLPIVGKYFYIPRGPVIKSELNSDSELSSDFIELINLAKENKAGWVRIEPASEEILAEIKKMVGTSLKLVRSPHDMQPKEIFVIDVVKTEEQLLAEMKSKTRYNIKLAEKKGVKIKIISDPVCHFELVSESKGEMLKQVQHDKAFYINEFLRLTKIMAMRQGITTHPDEYYRQMFEVIPENILKLYVAEYENKIIAANLVIFYDKICIYLHGASDDKYKNLMAPYLLQWQQIVDAKKADCEKYDFGGVKARSKKQEVRSKKNSWEGITRFKTSFSPLTQPVEFPGSYDIVISPIKYKIYRIMQKVKSFL